MLLSDILDEVRARFAHVESCPYQGKRIFFENAGGALTLKAVAEVSAWHAALPDNQGRDNPASQALMKIITQGKADAMLFFGASQGQVIAGESGTELLLRLTRAACLGAPAGGQVISSSLEHPASRLAARRWAKHTGRQHVVVAHDDASGLVTAGHYAKRISPETRVATIIHTSPVTGMEVDLSAIVTAIRAISPHCLIIVDGIQHAAHGAVNIDALECSQGGIDGYVISPYKMFSRHGYAMAWLSQRLQVLPHDQLAGRPEEGWELGTRDAGAYATFSEVIAYLEWLGAQFTGSPDLRTKLEAAGSAIHAHEKLLCDAMLHGLGNLPGLTHMAGVSLLGGADNNARRGLVSLNVEGMNPPELVIALRARGILTHSRKADHYSGSVLTPLGLEGCTRVSMCHYNSEAEVAAFLTAMWEITKTKPH